MIKKNLQKKQLNKDDIVSLLELADFSPVYKLADRIRSEHVGDVIHLRAIIEFSNICKRQCRYCGLNRENKSLPRFRMRHEEVLETAAQAVDAGYRTIVLQSGEDDYFTTERLGEIISDIKKLPGSPAVTISCGERSRADFAYFKEKGADRYLLKHETADRKLYDCLHPCGTLKQRVDCLKAIRELGYETGSGFMVGLPGQTLKTIAADLLLLKEIPCQMAGIGPFIANPKTPLAGERNGDPELTRRAVAIARLLLPEANLPLTTALSVLSQGEKSQQRDSRKQVDEQVNKSRRQQVAGSVNESGLQAERRPPEALAISNDEPAENPFAFGANVVMKKVTPDRYKAAYEIYPAEFKKTDIIADRQELEQLIKKFHRIPK